MRRSLILLAVLFALPATARAQEESETVKGIYPLVYHVREGDRSEFGILGPLIQFQSEPGKSYTAVLPFFSIERDDPIRLIDVYVLWPLVRWKQERDEVNFRAFPLVWHASDADSGGTLVLPLFWSSWREWDSPQGRRKRWSYVLFPFYWDLGREPGNRHFHIWPLYGHSRKGETRDSYYFLWPFFRYTTDSKRKETEVDAPWPIVLYRGEPDAFRLMVFPLFYLGRAPDESATVITPIVGHATDSRSSTTWVFPLFFTHATQKYRLSAFLLNTLVLQTSRKSKELSLIWPLISFRKDGEDRSLRIPPLIWGEATPESHWFLFAPLLYTRATPRASDFVLFPVFYNRRRGTGDSARGSTLLFPLYYDFRAPHSRLTVLFPLYGSLSLGDDHTRYIFPTILDVKRGDASYFHAWPLYGRHQVGDHYDRHFFLAPFFSYMSDRKKGEYQIDLFWPLFSYRRGQEMERLRFIPFAWYDRSLKGRSTVLFPFYWQSEDDESSYFYIFPLYGEQRRGETYLRQFFLSWAYVRTRDEERDLDRHDVLYPLITRAREGERTLTAVRPLFWHESSPKESRTILVPFFYNEVQEGRRLFLSIPYSREVREGESRWDNVLGLIYHRSRQGERTSQEILFPFIHTSSAPDRSAVEVRPLFWHARRGDEGHTLLLPFYMRFWGPRRDAVNLLPFYTRIERPDGSTLTSILGPVYFSRKTASSHSEDFLWPIVHHFEGPGVKKWQVRPLFWHEDLAGREVRTVLFPFYWRYRSPFESQFHIWPLFGYKTWNPGDNEHRQVSTVYPFFSYTWDRQDRFRRLDLFFPLFRTEVDREEATTWLFPLFFYDRDKLGEEFDTDIYIIPPLFYHGSRGERTDWNVLWKFITYEGREDYFDFTVLFELIRARKVEDSSLFRIFPLISYSSKAQRSDLSLLWVLFNYESEPDGFRFNVLHYFFRYESTEERFLLELNPLFSIETTPTTSYFAILGGLFSVESRPAGTDVGLLYFIKI